jgi:ankyrin repeat protein
MRTKQVAASCGHIDLVNALLSANADPHAVDAFGHTPLEDAVRLKQDAVSQLIRKRFPKIKFRLPGSELGVVMCTAASSGDLEQLQRLVASGVSPDEADYDGRTALHLAACEGRMEVRA